MKAIAIEKPGPPDAGLNTLKNFEITESEGERSQNTYLLHLCVLR